jgi:tetratricopeptide (TPR) repeat protein
MKLRIAFVALVALVSITCTIPAVSQFSGLGSVRGTCRDAEGKPIADAQVVWHNEASGRTYNLKTNKKGEYFSIGIEPSLNENGGHKYTVTLSKDGKVLETKKDIDVQAVNGETNLDFDLKAEAEQTIQDTAKQHGLTPEQVKQMQEQRANAEKYNANIKAINEKLKAATAATQANPPDYDAAIASLTEATQMGPDEDLLWFRLGNAYLESAKKQTDAAEKTKRNTEAYNDLQKAVDFLKKKSATKNEPQAGAAPAAKPAEGAASDNTKLAAYYDNLAAAAARLGKADDAANAYKQAAELDPARAGQYYFNLGAVLTNSSTDPNGKKEAVEAFDKAIAADPNRADAYYWKGSNLIAQASTDSNGKIKAPDGTAEAFQKYLELQPNGSHADEAKAMLTALNASVETSYGKKTPPKKK